MKPTTPEGWKAFHQANEAGMQKAYSSPDGLYKDGGKLFIAGTRGAGDVMDWPKIALGTFKGSKIYKRAEPAFAADKNINVVVGHSAGGSAAFELERNFPDRKITTISYSAPVFSPLDPAQLAEKDQPLRFKVVGDPVAALDENARTVWRAPDFNVGALTNLAGAYSEPTPANLLKVARDTPVDPTFGLHGMAGNYTQTSTPADFLKSAADGLAVGAALGAV